MQDLSDEKDEQNCKDINKFIAEPPAPGSGLGGNGGLGDLSNLNQEQLLSLLSQGPSGLRALREAAQGRPRPNGAAARPAQPAARTPATPSTPSNLPPARTTADALRNILSNLPAVSAPPVVCDLFIFFFQLIVLGKS